MDSCDDLIKQVNIDDAQQSILNKIWYSFIFVLPINIFNQMLSRFYQDVPLKVLPLEQNRR